MAEDDTRLGEKLLSYTTAVNRLVTPEEVLNKLHEITSHCCKLNVLGAMLLPLRWDDLRAVQLGKTAFLHKSAPQGWWEELLLLSHAYPNIGVMLAQLSIAPFTMSEAMQMLQPVGIDLLTFELALKYGMRDRFNCPVGGRWLVAYWSRTPLSGRLSLEARSHLYLGASFAAIQMQKLIEPNANRPGKGTMLTPRELAVLRLLSLGKRVKESADLLGLGEETVRSHLKKAEAKLGVREHTHAVAQAMRRRLIT
jgi:LuxR family quorum sensing-dependent transcriptional regulator